MYLVYGKQMYTWGFVRWGRFAEEIHNYENECVDFLILSDGRQILDISYATTICCLVENKVWFGERTKWRYAPPRWLFPAPIMEGFRF